MRNTITKLRSFLAAVAVSIATTWERGTDKVQDVVWRSSQAVHEAGPTKRAVALVVLLILAGAQHFVPGVFPRLLLAAVAGVGLLAMYLDQDYVIYNQALDIAELEDELELETEVEATVNELHQRGLNAEFDGKVWVVYDHDLYSPWVTRDTLVLALEAYLDEKGEGQ